ncbi:MAG: oxyanion-translocating ATPase [Haloquadratum walsbyi J07HQW2]|jgi:Oxyanion-translocating ATPase|uniref:Oxyanion-translocating ATPase n=1 Tax=Haloquadratum walsbyi J07HQW2 TaxID=1238425 RepID=U1PMW0_9EURY|nr:MAG: oxyanion-translocating ATPase [Haloquadratum walsbyi J07HQW2]
MTFEPSSDDTEFVFFTGKGGVGKSTVSCATATWLADNDYETLLVTTDPAPNLSDIFGQSIDHEVTAIDGIENLSAIEIDPDTAAEEYRQETIEPMRELLGEEEIQTVEEQLNSPCVEEIDVVSPAELCCHTLLIDDGSRHRSYCLLLLSHIEVDEADLREQAAKYGLEDEIDALLRYLKTHGEVDDDRLPEWDEFQELAADYEVRLS